MKYRCIKKNRPFYSVVKMSRALQVSTSGYYRWLSRPKSCRKRQKEELQHAIKECYDNHEGRAGSPTVTHDLRDCEKWKSISRSRVAREMQAMSLRCKTKKRFVVTTDSKHSMPVAPNLLNRDFEQEYPNRAWVSDITYLPVKNRWMYLVVFIDLFNRKVVGWDLSDTLEAEASITALNRVISDS
jgi:putative transposase